MIRRILQKFLRRGKREGVEVPKHFNARSRVAIVKVPEGIVWKANVPPPITVVYDKETGRLIRKVDDD